MSKAVSGLSYIGLGELCQHNFGHNMINAAVAEPNNYQHAAIISFIK